MLVFRSNQGDERSDPCRGGEKGRSSWIIDTKNSARLRQDCSTQLPSVSLHQNYLNFLFPHHTATLSWGFRLLLQSCENNPTWNRAGYGFTYAEITVISLQYITCYVLELIKIKTRYRSAQTLLSLPKIFFPRCNRILRVFRSWVPDTILWWS